MDAYKQGNVPDARRCGARSARAPGRLKEENDAQHSVFERFPETSPADGGPERCRDRGPALGLCRLPRLLWLWALPALRLLGRSRLAWALLALTGESDKIAKRPRPGGRPTQREAAVSRLIEGCVTRTVELFLYGCQGRPR